ncbi:MAG: DUF4287 domain-containing protein [Gemmatimonadaceae bacterium]|nr:DUF4287 domain-containing protein [Gemmatimonadaceae bacterium]
MADEAKAMATMVANIEKQTGKTLKQLGDALAKSGLSKHGELRSFLMEKFKLGHGQANTVVHLTKGAQGAAAAPAGDDPLDAIYVGKKADLRPIHEAVLKLLKPLGEIEVSPKKDYISYRRKKQFLMVGPKTNTQVEIGLFSKTLKAHARLKAMPAGGMCPFTTRLSDVGEVDATLAGWIKQSYGDAG